MIIIRRQNKKPDMDGSPVICAVQNNQIIKSWPNQAAITAADIAELQGKDTINCILAMTKRKYNL